METSYDIRIWKTEIYAGTRTATHTVRWTVAGKSWRKPFKTVALADAFRSELVTAARKGEAFLVATGHPASMHREERKIKWIDFAMEYVDMKWTQLAPNSRRNTARALTNATLAMTASGRGRPNDTELRKALVSWAFNSRARKAGNPTTDIANVLRWVSDNSRDVSDLAEPAVARLMLNAIAKACRRKYSSGRNSPAPAGRARQPRGVRHRTEASRY